MYLIFLWSQKHCLSPLCRTEAWILVEKAGSKVKLAEFKSRLFQLLVFFPGGSAGKQSACNAGDLASIPGLGRSSGEGKAYPLQYSGLKNSKDCIVHGVTKSQTWLSDFLSFLLSLTSVDRGKVLNPSEPPLLHLLNGGNNSFCFVGVWQRLHRYSM